MIVLKGLTSLKPANIPLNRHSIFHLTATTRSIGISN